MRVGFTITSHQQVMKYTEIWLARHRASQAQTDGGALLAANATVTIAHSRTADLAHVCRTADILLVAVGRPEMVKADWVKPGATIIDVGVNRLPAPERGEGKTRLVGDVDFDGCSPVAATITPVPGGVGPMTIAMLMANTVIAAYRSAGQPPSLLAILRSSRPARPTAAPVLFRDPARLLELSVCVWMGRQDALLAILYLEH